MKKLSTVPIILILLLFFATACGAAQQTAVNSPSANSDTAVGQPNNNVAPVSNVSVPVAQTVPNTAVDGDIVTEQTYTNVYKLVNPSVVNIQVIGQPVQSTFQFPDQDDESPSNPFEGIPGLPDDFENIPQIPSSGQGSGFVYDAEGHIVTNNHVVEGAEQITVIFADGTEAFATIVGTDPGSDLAVIKVEPEGLALVPVPIGDSDALEVGQLVATIGNPYGLTGSMSTGIVAGLGRTLPGASAPGGTSFNIPNIVQTDAVINPGNSGGPLLNLKGEVIGVNTAIELDSASYFTTPSFSGVGYAVPSNIVSQVVPQLIESGEVQHAWIGISGNTLTGEFTRAMGLPDGQRGILVQEVLEGGPAAEAGLRGSDETTTINGLQATIGGDIIVQIDDQPVNVFEDLLGYIVTQAGVGQEVTLTILRDGELMELPLTLAPRP